jgi:putative sigma-54 modulation protein
VQISVTGRHVEITDAIREHVMNSIQHAFREFPRLVSAHIILSVEKYRHIAEIVVHGPNHVEAEATHESDNLYASIDQAIEKAERQLRKAWDKMTERKARK